LPSSSSPPFLLDARRRHRRHEIDDATLLEAETSAILAAFELQERVWAEVGDRRRIRLPTPIWWSSVS
jgi:hypothetical protein